MTGRNTWRAMIGAGLAIGVVAGPIGSAVADDHDFDPITVNLAPCEPDGVSAQTFGFSFSDVKFAGIRVSDIHPDCIGRNLYVEVSDGAGVVLRQSQAIRIAGSTEDFTFAERLEALPAENVVLKLAARPGPVGPPDDDDDDDDHDGDGDHDDDDDHDGDGDGDHDGDGDEVGGSHGNLPSTGGGYATETAQAAAVALGVGALMAAAARRRRGSE